MPHSTLNSLLVLTLAACGGWPRHANLPAHESKAIRTDADPAMGIEIDWIFDQEEAEPNDAPDVPQAMGMGDGLVQSGTLSGSGWDAQAEPVQFSDCGEPLAFPPDSPGDYTGDVEWLSVEVQDAATLCATVTLDDTSLSFDLTVYVLDACNSPVEVFVDADGPIGVERTGGRWSSQVVVPAGQRIGIALGSYWPDDPDLETDWSMTLALVPPLIDIDLCPESP